jgi:hypothetical protein
MAKQTDSVTSELIELVEKTWDCRAAQSMDFVVEAIGEGQGFIVVRGRPTDDGDVEDEDCVKAHVYWLGDVKHIGPMICVCHIREGDDDSVEEIDSVHMSAEPNVLWAYIYAGN